jgi:hypothetical protein
MPLAALMSVISKPVNLFCRALVGLFATSCTTAPMPLVDGGGDASALPNLTAILRAPILQERVFSTNSCDVVEGCALPGRRTLLRFDLLTPNMGPGDLEMGAPTVDGRPRDGFALGTCHMHYHFNEYADYRLYTLDGREVGRGHKQAFCLEDSQPVDGSQRKVGDAERYTCNRQGIHAGWMDVYLRDLDCQYVDVTDVEPGMYRLRATVNGSRVLRENRYDDNTAEMVVRVGDVASDAGTDASVDVITVDPTAWW